MPPAAAGYCRPGCFRRLEKFPSKSAVIEISDAPDVAAAALNTDNLCQDKRDQYRKHREPCGTGDSEAHWRMGDCHYKNIVIYTGIYSTPFSRL